MTTAGVTGRVEDTVKIHKMTQWETDFSTLIVKMFQKLELGFNITVLDLHESMCPNLCLHLSDSNAQKRTKKKPCCAAFLSIISSFSTPTFYLCIAINCFSFRTKLCPESLIFHFSIIS